jgi:hypothetical protein
MTPKFLTEDNAAFAAKFVLTRLLEEKTAQFSLIEPGRKLECYIVVLVPSMEDDNANGRAKWPNYFIKPHCIYQCGWGDNKSWAHPFDKIAMCKALQLWHGRNDDRNNSIPHLLFPGDTPFYGGVKREGIVVACSGFKPYFDRMISGMIADMLIGIASDLFESSAEDRKRDFLR